MLAKQDVAEVGLYGKYPTSAVFYSGSKIVKLMHSDEVAGYVPKDFSWSSKNVMPYATLEENPYSFVVVTPTSYGSFIKEQKQPWHIVKEDAAWMLLRADSVLPG